MLAAAWQHPMSVWPKDLAESHSEGEQIQSLKKKFSKSLFPKGKAYFKKFFFAAAAHRYTIS